MLFYTQGESQVNRFQSIPLDSTSASSTESSCCQVLRLAVDPLGQASQLPVQLSDYGGFNYILSNETVNGLSYGVLTKNHSTGSQEWRYRLSIPSRALSFTHTRDGHFLIAGSTMGGTTDASLLARINPSGTAEWVHTYTQGQNEKFTDITKEVHANGSESYYMIRRRSPTENDIYRTTATVSSFNNSKRYNTLATGATPLDFTWHKLVASPAEELIAVGEINSSPQRGVVHKVDATGNIVAGKISQDNIRYTDAVRYNNDLIVISGEQEETPGGSMTPTLWIADNDLKFYDEIRWPDSLAGGVTSLTTARIRDTTFLYVGAVTTSQKAAVIRLSIDSFISGLTLVANDIDWARTLAAAAAINDYGFTRKDAFTIDTAAITAASVEVQTSRNGQSLLYAHGRTALGDNKYNLYYGQLSLDLTEPCIKNYDHYPIIRTVVNTENNSPDVNTASLPGYTSRSGVWIEDGNRAEQRCHFTDLDGCQLAYPMPTWGYFKLVPGAECAGKMLMLEVLNAQGRVVLSGAVSGSRAALIDISDSPRGIYLVKWKDQNGKVLHSSMIQLT